MNQYINFGLPVTPITAQALVDLIVSRVPDDTDVLHLIINSPGGSIPVAFGLAKFLEGLSCKLFTYNISRCDSAAIIMFVAGEERISVPEGCFFAHAVNVELTGYYSLDALRLEYKKLRQQHNNIISYLSQRTKITSRCWQRYMTEKGHVFTAAEAMRKGLVTKIGELTIQQQSKLLNVEVDNAERGSGHNERISESVGH